MRRKFLNPCDFLGWSCVLVVVFVVLGLGGCGAALVLVDGLAAGWGGFGLGSVVKYLFSERMTRCDLLAVFEVFAL
jgi:hypothetical protein